jgi:hypothetical protein
MPADICIQSTQDFLIKMRVLIKKCDTSYLNRDEKHLPSVKLAMTVTDIVNTLRSYKITEKHDFMSVVESEVMCYLYGEGASNKTLAIYNKSFHGIALLSQLIAFYMTPIDSQWVADDLHKSVEREQWANNHGGWAEAFVNTYKTQIKPYSVSYVMTPLLLGILKKITFFVDIEKSATISLAKQVDLKSSK